MSDVCPVCKKEIDKKANLEAICEEFDGLLDQVDYWGQDSLTEREQVIYNNLVHVDCYENLK
jgi:hypothetical protein